MSKFESEEPLAPTPVYSPLLYYGISQENQGPQSTKSKEGNAIVSFILYAQIRDKRIYFKMLTIVIYRKQVYQLFFLLRFPAFSKLFCPKYILPT